MVRSSHQGFTAGPRHGAQKGEDAPCRIVRQLVRDHRRFLANFADGRHNAECDATTQPLRRV